MDGHIDRFDAISSVPLDETLEQVDLGQLSFEGALLRGSRVLVNFTVSKLQKLTIIVEEGCALTSFSNALDSAGKDHAICFILAGSYISKHYLAVETDDTDTESSIGDTSRVFKCYRAILLDFVDSKCRNCRNWLLLLLLSSLGHSKRYNRLP